MRSYATEVAARKAARALVTPDEDNCRFAAARLWGPFDDVNWPIGVVEQYLPDDDNPPGQDNPQRIDLLASHRILGLRSMTERMASAGPVLQGRVSDPKKMS